MTNDQIHQSAQGLGRAAAIVEAHCPDMLPTRVAQLCSDPGNQFARLMLTYRQVLPLDERLEERMCKALSGVSEIPPAGQPLRDSAACAFWSAYYRERADIRPTRKK